MIRIGGKRLLQRAGFTRTEIDLIDTAETPTGMPQDTDVTTPAWQAVMRSRRQYVDVMTLRGYTRQQIRDFINRYYQNPKRSPFDFLKAEYNPPKKLGDFKRAMKLRAQKRIQRQLGNKYGLKR